MRSEIFRAVKIHTAVFRIVHRVVWQKNTVSGKKTASIFGAELSPMKLLATHKTNMDRSPILLFFKHSKLEGHSAVSIVLPQPAMGRRMRTPLRHHQELTEAHFSTHLKPSLIRNGGGVIRSNKPKKKKKKDKGSQDNIRSDLGNTHKYHCLNLFLCQKLTSGVSFTQLKPALDIFLLGFSLSGCPERSESPRSYYLTFSFNPCNQLRTDFFHFHIFRPSMPYWATTQVKIVSPLIISLS
jgi:hypothetical protein